MTQKNIAADLDKFLKRASAKKADDISAALDNVDNHTVPVSTGEQASSMKEEAKDSYTAAAVDVGAQTNQVGASVTNNTDGSAAASTNGQEGAESSEQLNDDPKEADNGDEKPQNQIDGNGGATGSFKSAAEIRAVAKALRKAASLSLSPVNQFLVKAARASSNPQIKKAAEGMDDEALADAAAGDMESQLAGGQISDEEAVQILQEAVAEGAISEEELQAAVAEMQGGEAAADAGAVDAAAGDPGAAGVEDAAAAADMGAADADMGAATEELPPGMEEEMTAKMAAADIGPDHKNYVTKLASLYPAQMHAGYKYAEDLAAFLKKTAEEGGEEKEEEAVDDDLKAESDEEKAALAAVQSELNVSDEDLAKLASVPAASTKTMSKQAALEARYRFAIINKAAALN